MDLDYNLANDFESSDSDEEFLFLYLSFIKIFKSYRNLRKRKRRIRRWKVQPLNRDWANSGYHQKVFRNIQDLDGDQFFVHTRMSKDIFDMLLDLVGNALRKPYQRISPLERLSITLLHLAHGTSIRELACSHKLGKTTVRNIILETCEVLWKELSPQYVSEPSQAQYIDIEKDFNRLWDLPNCVGAIAGKHIAVRCPPGPVFHNYRNVDSIALLAVCDANYTFTSVSIGSYGSQIDEGVFKSSPFGEALFQDKLPLPPDKPLTSNSTKFPHYFIGDAAVPLRKNLMKPYSTSHLNKKNTVYNHRLSRGSRVIENSFGILVARWRVLLTTIECLPSNCETIILACIALHNFIMLNDYHRCYCSNNLVDSEGEDGTINKGEWRSIVKSNGDRPLKPISSHARRSSDSAMQLRDLLADFFMNDGNISAPVGFNID